MIQTIITGLIIASIGSSMPLSWTIEDHQIEQELYRAETGHYQQLKQGNKNYYQNIYTTPEGHEGYQLFIVTDDYVYSYGYGDEAEDRTYITTRGENGINVSFDDISISIPPNEPPIVSDPNPITTPPTQ